MDSSYQRQNHANLKLRKPLLALGLLACYSAFYLWFEDPVREANHSNYLSYNDHEHGQVTRQLEAVTEMSTTDTDSNAGHSPTSSSSDDFAICGRSTNPVKDLPPSLLTEVAATCKPIDIQKPILILNGHNPFGRTGNHLQIFFNAMQYARDNNAQVGIMMDSWAMDLIIQFFFVSDIIGDGNVKDGWQSRMERALCIKIFRTRKEARKWQAVLKNTKDLFRYHSTASPEEYKAGYVHSLRTLFRHYNTGTVREAHVDDESEEHEETDMCSGIDSLIEKGVLDERTSANFTVIHLRYLEGKPGLNILANQALYTGCDPKAGLEMRPEYVKSILKPLGMMDKPLIVITDHQHKLALGRLMHDTEIRRILHVVPVSASWFGGDVTLGVTANVFIGNPASTLSLFVARARASLGFNNNYLFRAWNEDSHEWYTSCGDECLFKRNDKDTAAAGAKLVNYFPVQEGNKSNFLGRPRHIPSRSLATQRAFEQALKDNLVGGIIEREAEREASLETRDLVQVRRSYPGLHPEERASRGNATVME